MPKEEKKRFKQIEVPIFTEEYKVIIFIGTKESMLEPTVEYTDLEEEYVEERLTRCRGNAWYRSDLHPLITLNGELDWQTAMATMAHEACHAMDWISDFIQVDDRNGEFKAHGVGAIMRATTASFTKSPSELSNNN